MSKKKRAANKKQLKREKKLAKGLMRDFEKLLAISISSGSVTQESIATLLKGISDALTRTEKKHGPGDFPRKPGRFLEGLHQAHKKVIKNGQLAKEDHDLKSLTLVHRMAKKGKSNKEIARKMQKLGERITPEGISRILAEKP